MPEVLALEERMFAPEKSLEAFHVAGARVEPLMLERAKFLVGTVPEKAEGVTLAACTCEL